MSTLASIHDIVTRIEARQVAAEKGSAEYREAFEAMSEALRELTTQEKDRLEEEGTLCNCSQCQHTVSIVDGSFDIQKTPLVKGLDALAKADVAVAAGQGPGAAGVPTEEGS